MTDDKETPSTYWTCPNCQCGFAEKPKSECPACKAQVAEASGESTPDPADPEPEPDAEEKPHHHRKSRR